MDRTRTPVAGRGDGETRPSPAGPFEVESGRDEARERAPLHRGELRTHGVGHPLARHLQGRPLHTQERPLVFVSERSLFKHEGRGWVVKVVGAIEFPRQEHEYHGTLVLEVAVDASLGVRERFRDSPQ